MKSDDSFDLEKIVHDLDGVAGDRLAELKKKGFFGIYMKRISTIEELQRKNPVAAAVFHVLLEAFVKKMAVSNHAVAYVLDMEAELVDESLERLSEQGMPKLAIEQNASFYTFVPDRR